MPPMPDQTMPETQPAPTGDAAVVQQQLRAWKIAEAKRHRAPVALGVIAGGISAVTAFTRWTQSCMRDIMRVLGQDGNRYLDEQGEVTGNAVHYGNEDLARVMGDYRDMMQAHGHEMNAAEPGKPRGPMTDWLNRLQKHMKERSSYGTNETLNKEQKKYTSDMKTLAEHCEEALSKVEEKWGSSGNLEEYLWQKEQVYKQHIAKMLMRREQWRYAVYDEQILSLRQQGISLSFMDLTPMQKLKTMAGTAVVSIAAATLVRQFMEYITRERPAETAQRVKTLQENLGGNVPVDKASLNPDLTLALASRMVEGSEEPINYRDKVNAERQKAASTEKKLG